MAHGANVQASFAQHSDAHRHPFYVIGVSGGRDSVVLFHILAHSGVSSTQLCAVHVHHGLRDEADRDAAFVEALGQSLGVRTVVRHVDVPAAAASHGMSLEMAARALRYRVFHDVLDAEGYRPLPGWCDPIHSLQHAPYQSASGQMAFVVLAHHAVDHAESMLLHIGRGTGLDGLMGMAPERGAILRPLLGWGPGDFGAYLHRHDLSYRSDLSNTDPRFLRNRIRHELMPLWSELIGSDVSEALVRLQAHVASDHAYISEGVDAAVHALTYGYVQGRHVDGAPWVIFDREPPTSGEATPVLDGLGYRALHRTLRVRLLKRFDPLGGYDLAKVHLDAMDQMLMDHAYGVLDLPRARRFQLVKGRAWIESSDLKAYMTGAQYLQVGAGWGNAQIPLVWQLNVIESADDLAYNDTVYTHFTDTATRRTYSVRTARSEDRLDRQIWGQTPPREGTDRYRRVRAQFGIPPELLRRCLWCVHEPNILIAPAQGCPAPSDDGDERTAPHGLPHDR